MLLFTDIQDVQLPGPTYLTIGNFDGLHRGHQLLLQTLRERAAADKNRSARTGLVTFSPHPLTILRPHHPLHLLTSPEERLELAAVQGIDVGIIQPFTQTFAQLSPRDFLLILKRRVGLAGLVVGPDFALGRGRAGDLAVLEQMGTELQFDLTIVEPQLWEGKTVSSSSIRNQLRQGEVAEAARLLGRNYRVSGVVVTGDKRGRQIGVPTANVETVPNRLLPRDGVYATRTYVAAPAQTAIYDSVSNLGVRPTVDGFHHHLETHLLDFPAAGESDDLYGRTLAVEFLMRLRGEQRFSSLDALVAQIEADIVLARRLFRQMPPSEPVDH